MDNLTHTLAGLLLGAALPADDGRGLPLKARAAFCALATNLPDLDGLVALGALPFEALNLHRGISHSFVMAPLWGTLAGVLGWLALRRRHRLAEFIVLGIASFLLHDALDLLTSYGTQIFAPFSTRAHSLPLLFIFDPYLWLLLATGAFVAWRRESVALARGGLVVLTAYVALCGGLMLRAESVAAQQAERQGLAHDVLVRPQPLSPAHWKIVVVDGDRYHTSYLDLFGTTPREPVRLDAPMLEQVWGAYQPADHLEWTHRHRYGAEPLMRGFARFAWGREELAEFRRFALLPQLYSVSNQSEERGCAWFTDLRFEIRSVPNPFVAGLCHGPDGDQLSKSVGWEIASAAGPPARGL